MANVATDFLSRFAAGDVMGALELTTDDFRWTVGGKPGGGFALAGTYDQAGYLEMLGRAGASLPAGPQVEVVSVTESVERAVVETHVVATSADGIGYDNRVVCVFDLDGGKIAAVREYLDTIHAAEVFTH